MVDYAAWTTIGITIDAIGGAAFIALGAAVAWIRPRTQLSLWFAAFSIPYGLYWCLGNLLILWMTIGPGNGIGASLGLTFDAAVGFFFLACLATSGVALVGMARVFPTPAGRFSRVSRFALGAAVVAAVAISWVSTAASDNATAREAWFVSSGTVASVGFFAFLGALATRFPHEESARGARHMALVSAVVLGFTGFTYATNTWKSWAFFGDTTIIPSLYILVLHFAILGKWLIHTTLSDPARSRAARNVCLAGFVGTTAGVLFPPLTSPLNGADLGPNGLVRLAAVGVLAYAILRFQLFDIDVKLKWAVRQGPVAAFFFAAFFFVTELTADVFQSVIGPVVGLVAAGVLVFVLAHPLQRLGDRLATKALPGAAPVGRLDAQERYTIYAELVESAWRDGFITPREQRMLATASTRLGLTLQDVHAIERDAGVA